MDNVAMLRTNTNPQGEIGGVSIGGAKEGKPDSDTSQIVTP